ncbi:MAG TPA: hypothetical protein V6C81_13525 [Planktothrix sp.]
MRSIIQDRGSGWVQATPTAPQPIASEKSLVLGLMRLNVRMIRTSVRAFVRIALVTRRQLRIKR